MDPVALAVQFGGGLVVVVLLAWATRRMGLGGEARIRDEGHARELAAEACWGFEATDVAVDRAGFGALVRGRDGRVLLLRRHGAHFAARPVEDHSGVRLDRNFLTIETADRRFGAVTLDLGGEAQVWAGSLRRLRG